MKKQAQARLLKAIAGLHKQYDPKERMLQIPFSTPGYHTALKGGMVHPIRQSLDYAVNLLDTEKRYRRWVCQALTSSLQVST